MAIVAKHYSGDFNMSDLKIELQTLAANFEGEVSLRNFVNYLQPLRVLERGMLVDIFKRSP